MQTANCSTFTGWAWNAQQPNNPIYVDLYDSTTIIAHFLANLSGSQYGNGNHNFSFTIPSSLKDGLTHTISAYFGGTTIFLSNSPQSINCPAGTTGYVYYYNDQLTSINLSYWGPNGNVSATSSGLTATTPGGGALISTVASPTTNDYEVKTTLNLTVAGGTYVKQIMIIGAPPPSPGPVAFFAQPGDSGSLVVTDTPRAATDPQANRPVGLLVGGSVRGLIINHYGSPFEVTFANPIATVLDAFAKLSVFKTPNLKFVGTAQPLDTDALPSSEEQAAALVQDSYDDYLMSLPEVVGHGIGLSQITSGEVVIHVYLRQATPEAIQALPTSLGGWPVMAIEIGEIVAY